MNESIGNFDEFAKNYNEVLSSALGLFGNENAYYAYRKVELLSELVGAEHPQRVLDFGCGVGSVIQHLFNFFPDSDIWGTDPSAQSLQLANRLNPQMHCVTESDIPSNYFDYVIISNVLHHIPESARGTQLEQISKCLVPGGKLVIFEHNKLNPITRRIVDRCEFDEGVELLSRQSASNLIRSTGNFENLQSGYFLFVPPILKRLRKVEHLFGRVPLGAQFWLTARQLG
jgi:SAM-dependent methyltransferase